MLLKAPVKESLHNDICNVMCFMLLDKLFQIGKMEFPQQKDIRNNP